MTRIVIDTDLGGDIDDALALSLALVSPEIEIVGITTVYLAAEWRARVIQRILKAYKRTDLKIALGTEKPLCGWWDEKRPPDTGKAAPELEGVVTVPACDYLIEQVNKYEDLIILAIGPLTNIALMLAKEPQIASRTRIVMMGGQMNKAHPEWNIACDPEAARIVFESGIAVTMVGLDVTNRCRFTYDHIDRIKAASNERTDLLHEMILTFIEQFGFMPVLHDPLALAAIIWPELVTFEEKTILIETRGEFTRGVTVDCDWKHQPNAMAAVDVKVEDFIDNLLVRITR